MRRQEGEIPCRCPGRIRKIRHPPARGGSPGRFCHAADGEETSKGLPSRPLAVVQRCAALWRPVPGHTLWGGQAQKRINLGSNRGGLPVSTLQAVKKAIRGALNQIRR